MEAGKKDKKGKLAANDENTSPVCYSNSSEIRPEYVDYKKDEDFVADNSEGKIQGRSVS